MSQSNEPFKNFVNDHKFTFVTSLAGILGFILALTVFFPSQKRPFYSVKSFNLINNSSSTIENLDIKYKSCDSIKENNQGVNKCEQAIESLTITKILFWNGGRKKIDKTDIDDNPITIVASENNSILEAKVIQSSNDKTDFRLNSENNTINFNFLDSSNGGVIEVIHTGLSDEDITLDAYVEESRFEGKVKHQKLEVPRSINESIITLFALSLGAALGLLYEEWAKNDKTKYIWTVCVVILSSFMIVYIFDPSSFTKLLLRYPSTSYEVFNSEISK